MGRVHVKERSGFLWAEEGEPRQGVVAVVAIGLPVYHTYSFAVPEALRGSIQLGQRVKVPIRRRGQLTTGFVVELDWRPWDSTLRPIHSTLDDVSFLSRELIALGREISGHYCCPLGQTLKSITPEAVRRQRGLRAVRYAELSTPSLSKGEGQGEAQNSPKREALRITPARRALLDALSIAAAPLRLDALLKDSGSSSAVLAGLVKAGLVRVTIRREAAGEDAREWQASEPAFELTTEQQAALAGVNATIDDRRFGVTLLFGVSGSGKTEVYVRAIRRVVERGQQAILLVPEIVLTTQVVGRLAGRFPSVAVMHSGLTEAQRSLQWRRVSSGEKQVVIGTRSAVFAPCPKLGLICVDEEQESSYKNVQAPRFHVRDVAIMRGKLLGIPVLLGSATPSLETWHDSQNRADFHRLELPRRVRDLPLPVVHLVNMEEEIDEVKRPVVLSRPLERLLGETLARGEQALILMNRRGYAQRIYCPDCRTRITCPNCNVGLVVHSAAGLSICHYCRGKIITPTRCPNVSCRAKLVQSGLGTQRIETLLRELFPTAKIQRVDSDTMRHRSHYQRMVDDFEARKIDVMVGTQMIAKGLDFPFVSFVGVVNADPVAMAVDFRAHERLFQLLTQVAGRAGRADAPGQVVVQTTNPNLPALAAALRHDYVAFANAELRDRARAGLPPFRRLTRFVLTHRREETARREGESLAARIHAAIESLKLPGADLIGPNPCALSRLRGRYRYDVLIRAADASDVRRLMAHLIAAGDLRTKAQSTIMDVDPVELM